ncbi:MAG TPA: DUF6311 domain-containing protein [Rhizomicrobium sp.]
MPAQKYILPHTPPPNGLLFACFACAAGILDALLLFGWHDINPSHLDWLRGDPAVYQAGWEFLRRSPWTFPPTWIAGLDYPFGVSAAYLDVIPIVAVPLRLISGLLPADFQYLGLYAALCLILQTWFGLKLLSRFTSDIVFMLIGALFFLNAPILVSRLWGHFSLCSQWLLLAGLYYYFAPIKPRRFLSYVAPFMALLAVAGAITPYIAVMILAIGTAALFRWRAVIAARGDIGTVTLSTEALEPPSGRLTHLENSLAGGLLYLATLIAVALVAFFVFGFLVFGAHTQFDSGGYTVYSMNLLGPVIGGNRGPDSNYFNVLPGQGFEGYNYLGIGIILLGAVCLARRPLFVREIWTPSVRPIVIFAAMLALLALSVKITLGPATLVTIPVPKIIFHALAAFRSSGRFFWPAHYLLMLGAILGSITTFKSPAWRNAVLALAFLVQYFDTLSLRVEAIHRAQDRYEDPLEKADWQAIGSNHKHLVILPARQCDLANTPGGDTDWPYFARLAARRGMTLNSTHAARASAASNLYNCVQLPQQVIRGKLASDTAYVLSDRLVVLAIEHNTTHFCRRVDGFNLCIYNPEMAGKSQLLKLQLVQP